MSLSGDGVAVMTALHHRDDVLARDLVYESDRAGELALWLAESFVHWLEDHTDHDVDHLLQHNGLRFAQGEMTL
jgi:hypothetical protein